MDPKQTLLDAEDAYDTGRYMDAFNLLGEYNEWRNKGGFEPEGGDAWYQRLLVRVSHFVA